MHISSAPISNPDDSDHKVELITQSLLEENTAIQPTPMELETNPRKKKVPTASEDTPEPPSVTLARTLRPQHNRSLDGSCKIPRKKSKQQIKKLK